MTTASAKRLLIRSCARISLGPGAVQRPVELCREKLGKRVVDVEDHRRAAELGSQRREDEHVGHVVGLHQIEWVPLVQGGHDPEGADEEACVAAEVAPRSACRLVLAERVDPDDARAGSFLAGGRQADQIDLVAALGQRARLALDP